MRRPARGPKSPPALRGRVRAGGLIRGSGSKRLGVPGAVSAALVATLRPGSLPQGKKGPSAAILLTLLASLFAARPAMAHAVLVGSLPADGAVLAAAPAEAVLHFDEPVTPGRIELLDSSGKSATAGAKAVARDAEIHLPLPTGLAAGSYLLSYRVTSLDSHPVGGSIVFTIGKASAADIAQLQSRLARSVGPWPLLATATRLLLFIGLIGAAGGTLFHTLVAHDLWRLDKGTRRGLVALASLALVAALLGIGIEGAALGGGDLFNAGLWRLGEQTSLGFSLTLAAGALLLLILALEQTRGRLSLLALPASLIALGSLALTGHALTAGPLWLTLPLLAIHVLIAAFWLGSLWPLWQAVARRRPEAALALLRRFSSIAAPAVLLLIAAGAAIAFLQLDRLGDLLSTAYGLRLAFKLAFVLLLLLMAALNRLWLTPALAAGRASAPHRLRASIGLEIGLGMAILAATGSLGEVPPPRALAAQTKAAGETKTGFTAVTFTGGRGAEIEVSPARAGPNAITIHLFEAASGTPLTPKQVTIELSQPAAGVEAMEHPLTADSPGVYRLADTPLPLAGSWNIRLLVLISDFEEIRFETRIPIR
jgi:copper transport protein